MVVFMLVAIVLKGSQALFTITTGKHINSLPVIAAGTDNRNDVITSIIIVIGMLVNHYTGLQLDGYMGLLVALFILYSGVNLVKETLDPILGKAADEELVKEIEGEYGTLICREMSQQFDDFDSKPRMKNCMEIIAYCARTVVKHAEMEK